MFTYFMECKNLSFSGKFLKRNVSPLPVLWTQWYFKTLNTFKISKHQRNDKIERENK